MNYSGVPQNPSRTWICKGARLRRNLIAATLRWKGLPIIHDADTGNPQSIGSNRVLDSGPQIPALNGVRGVAILLVIVCHFIAFALPYTPARWLRLVASVGGTGVDLFFVLSGFLITRILLASRQRPAFLTTFYARRILRIFPLYYGFLAAIYIAVPLLHLGQPIPFGIQLWAWTYTQNVAMTFLPHPATDLWQWTPHLWSLAVEEHFYLVWPLIVKLTSPARLPLVLLATIPFSILSRGLVM